tara:strand:+ start:6461 stop:7300 length:840 start_codon:yes stop_codon:yes gene_type:complete
MKNKPIIITGMHRSGTSLVTELLSKYIFIGKKNDVNNESLYFQRINRWLLSCNSCSWDNPLSFNDLNHNELNILISKLNQNINKRIPNLIFFGFGNIFYNKNFFNLNKRWGWKDPVNVFTLYLWSKVFKDFKVINVNRNPLDVSFSLLNRQKNLSVIDSNISTRNPLAQLIPILSINKGGVYSSFKINNIDDCLKLYKKYYDQMLVNDNMFKEILNIRYEKLIVDSYNEVKKIYKFCNIETDSINEDIKIINSNKRNNANKESTYNINLLDGLPQEIEY